MKTRSIMVGMLLMAMISAQAQTKQTQAINTCDELKKENDFLKKVLKINEPIKVAEQDDLEIRLIAAKGNSKTQTIKLEYLITNKIKIRHLTLNAGLEQVVSVGGDIIPFTTGYDVYDLDVITYVPLKTTMTVGTILPENKILKLVTFKYLISAGYTTKGMVEFRDVPVEWK